ncbi:Eukaryotic translation initiation factor 2 subunit gamma, partial [Fusarium albosuccineum]
MSANGDPKYDDIESESDSGESTGHHEAGDAADEKPLKSAPKKSNPAI